MSLINKMLQDLDARGGPGRAGVEMLKPVPMPERRAPQMVIRGVAVAAVLALVGAGAYAGWRYLKQPDIPKPAGVKIAQGAAPVVQVPKAIDPAPAAEPLKAEPKAAAIPPQEPAEAVANAAVPVPEEEESAHGPARVVRPTAATPVQASPQAARTKPAAARLAAAKESSGREMTAQQRAESEYRRAGSALQEGRVAEAVLALEQALALQPQHEAARQTLVSLLVEARRYEEAIRVLQAGLVLDPRQPNMAMLLARLQIERGGPAIETLQRTLPYAAGNDEYHGFLAGALQREQRHREAIEQYQAAVRAAPYNGVWLMGLGISLQAEKRNSEALDAFQRAKASGTLSQDLSAFVERRLQALGR